MGTVILAVVIKLLLLLFGLKVAPAGLLDQEYE
jgi:hypothetical protein